MHFSEITVSTAQIPLGSSRVDTQHVRRVESMHFANVELVEQHGSTHNLVHCVICIKL